MQLTYKVFLAVSFILGPVVTGFAQEVGETFEENDLRCRILTVGSDGNTIEILGPEGAVDNYFAVPASLDYEGQTYRIVSLADNSFKRSRMSTLDLSGATFLQRIGASAFADCAKLTTVIFPPAEQSSLTEIGTLAFYHDTALQSFNLEDTRLEVLESFFSENEDDEITIEGLTTLKLPETLKEVKPYALQFLDITEIEFPAGITNIGDRILEGCIYLREFIWENAQVTRIPKHFFLGDDKLEKVVLYTVEPLEPDGLTDLHFFMCDKSVLHVYVTQASADNLAQNWYTTDKSVYSTLVANPNWTSISAPVSDRDTKIAQHSEDSDDAYYTLQGLRVSSPQPQRLYIYKGRKVIFNPTINN